ncbi:hypothetical protein BC827DRAFT_1247659 [Russula dissimulans]|nr:hypothetical protein BC827DRAFT_1247659 [Russula dissimulans]
MFHACLHRTTVIAHLTRVLICWTLCPLDNGEDGDEGCSDLTLPNCSSPCTLPPSDLILLRANTEIKLFVAL